MEQKKERILWMDVLNVLACIGVILLHVSNNEIHSYSGNFSLVFVWGVITHTFSYWPVPIFLMLSGANNLKYSTFERMGGVKTFYKKRFFKAVVPFLLWSLLYIVIFVPKCHFVSSSDAVSYFAQIKYNGYMWFFVPLFALYLCAPFIAKFLDQAAVKDIKLLIFFGVVFTVFIPTGFRLLDSEGFKYSLFPLTESLLFYPILGFVINKFQIEKKYRNLIYIVGFAAAIIHFTTLLIAIGVYNIPSSRVQNVCSPTSLLMAIAVFVLFKYINWNNYIKEIHISQEIVASLSSCSLGVYLIQYLIFIVTAKFGYPFQSPFLGVFATYPTAVIIVYIMKKLPLLRYMVP